MNLNIIIIGGNIFDVLIACIIGVLCGALTGIIPGVHVNTVGAFIFAYSANLLIFFSTDFLAVFLISMAISHSMIDFLPSMFLGVPEEGTVLSVLPGHYFMLMGRGKEAVRLVYNWWFWFTDGNNCSTAPICFISTANILDNKTIHLSNSCPSCCVHDQKT
jgi:hypothetical protein